MASDWREQSGAGTSSDGAGGQRFESGEVRSWDQVVENGTPSTSPPYWDTDDDDDDSGARPADLYGKFTWKIENFSQISKRELRSNVFEVGGYKWYILVYPQGCDVCNHLSLFLCVSDYDKLLPGWSHFAQFTIAVVNKDPKKSKYSDTLHRFCKKEHDWGWKKFMELSKVYDGFIVADILVIKAQVQVIRENPHRPFRCLDCQYRRELVRVYLTNVEGICRRFVEEKREKFGKLIEDSVRWSSFRAFWAAIEENVQHRLAREKTDVILKGIVKRFFNEKEVTSTLVMDALYSGCKALNYRSRNKKEITNSTEVDGASSHVVWVEKDSFVLADDVLSLLERVATERLPPFKEDKGPQNRTKDASSGDEFGKDSVERDERHLTELGRRTIEIFVLAHLFSNRVEVAYREAIALKRQEELIREEEAAGQAEIEFRAKREAAEKEKRSRKKQAKQRRNNRKEKEQGKEKGDLLIQDKHQHENSPSSRKLKECYLEEHSMPNHASLGTAEEDDDLSGLETTDNVVGTLGPAMEDGDTDQADWDRDGSETPQAMEASFSGDICLQPAQSGCVGRKHQTAPDDSSSTCSTDSLASVVVNGSYKGRILLPDHSQRLTRGKNKAENERFEKASCSVEPDSFGRFAGVDLSSAPETSSSSNAAGLEAETAILSLKERVQWLEQRLVEKDEEVVLLQSKLGLQQSPMDHDKPSEQFQDEPVDCYFTGDSGLLSTLDVNAGKQESSCIQVNAVSMDPDKPCSVIELPTKHSLPNDLRSQSSNLLKCNLTPNKSNGQFTHPSGKQDLLKLSTYQSNSTDSSHPLPTMSVSSSLAVPQGKPLRSIESPSTSNGQFLVQSINGTSTMADISRPSSAPLIPSGARPSVPVASVQSVPSLARSASAAGRLGFGETMASNSSSFVQSPVVTPSYKMAATGKIRGTSGYASHWVSSATTPTATGSFQAFSAPQTSSFLHKSLSSAFSPCTAVASPSSNNKVGISCGQSSGQVRGDASSSVAITSCISSSQEQNICSSIAQSERPMSFTFGTVTPELLKRQQSHKLIHNADVFIRNMDEKSCEMDCHGHKESFLDQYVQQLPQGLKNLKVHQAHFEQDNFDMRIQPPSMQHLRMQASPTHTYSESNDARQACSVTSEEFPHLDIINDLLDEEHYRGKEISVMLQHSRGQDLNQQLLYPGLHRINSGHLHPDINLLNGDRVERARVYEEGMFQVHCSSDPSSIVLREGLQMVPPYAHSSYGQSYGQQCGLFDGIPSPHWPISSADFSGCSITNNEYGGLNAFVGYPMHGNHISLGDCSSFTSGQNEYTVYSPMKEL